MLKSIIASVVASVVVVAVIMVAFPSTQTVIERVGANPGPEFYSHLFAKQGVTAGGYVATTTDYVTVSYTTQAKDFASLPTVFSILPNINTTITLDASSTLAMIPVVGDATTIYVRNASTTAGATITFAAKNSSLDLQFAEATGGDLVLSGLDWAKVTFIRTAALTVTVIFDEMTEAD
jgi:hypothetical protein